MDPVREEIDEHREGQQERKAWLMWTGVGLGLVVAAAVVLWIAVGRDA